MAVVDLVIVPERQQINGESTGTVTLSRAADAGGQVVVLSSSDNDVARVPTSITVPAGATTATFIVKAAGETSAPGGVITSNTLVILEAKINGVGRAAGFVVEPR
jgi:hypothetical protein